MGRAMMPYAVDLGALRAAIGSGDTALKAELAGDRSEAEARAAAELIDGATPTEDAVASAHGFERLCARFGAALGNANTAPCPAALVERTHDVLEPLGLGAVSLLSLAYGGAPVELPPIDDYPSVGFAEAEAVRAARERWLEASPASEDDDVDDALCDIEDWLEAAAARGAALVVFYY